MLVYIPLIVGVSLALILLATNAVVSTDPLLWHWEELVVLPALVGVLLGYALAPVVVPWLRDSFSTPSINVRVNARDLATLAALEINQEAQANAQTTELATINRAPIVVSEKISAREAFDLHSSRGWWYTDAPDKIEVNSGVIRPVWNGMGRVCRQPSMAPLEPATCWLVKAEMPHKQ